MNDGIKYIFFVFWFKVVFFSVKLIYQRNKYSVCLCNIVDWGKCFADYIFVGKCPTQVFLTVWFFTLIFWQGCKLTKGNISLLYIFLFICTYIQVRTIYHYILHNFFRINRLLIVNRIMIPTIYYITLEQFDF